MGANSKILDTGSIPIRRANHKILDTGSIPIMRANHKISDTGLIFIMRAYRIQDTITKEYIKISIIQVELIKESTITWSLVKVALI